MNIREAIASLEKDLSELKGVLGYTNQPKEIKVKANGERVKRHYTKRYQRGALVRGGALEETREMAKILVDNHSQKWVANKLRTSYNTVSRLLNENKTCRATLANAIGGLYRENSRV